MSNLLCFKEWLTIKETSRHLSKILNEKVKSKDIDPLTIEDKLVLSLCIINWTYVEKKQIQFCLSLIEKETASLFSHTYYWLISYQQDSCCIKDINVLEHLSSDMLLIVVRISCLQVFINHFKQDSMGTIEKNLHCKEHISLYKIFAILIKINNLPQVVANIIKTYGDSLGFDSPSSHTIAKYLKETNHYLPEHENLIE